MSTNPKFQKVMREYSEGKLHSGSKKGPKVTSVSQAAAIAYSEMRKKARNDALVFRSKNKKK